MTWARGIAAVCVVLVTVFVLYVPSAHPPAYFVEQLRFEHNSTVAFWGQDHAMRILARMLALRSHVKDASPVAQPVERVEAGSPVNAALTSQVVQVTTRLYSNEYFNAVEALLVLASYRYAELVEWLGALAILIPVIWFDALVRRIVKSKEFLHHNPEVYGLHLCFLILLLGATIIAFVLPAALPPWTWALMPIGFAFFSGFAIANFHRRG